MFRPERYQAFRDLSFRSLCLLAARILRSLHTSSNVFPALWLFHAGTVPLGARGTVPPRLFRCMHARAAKVFHDNPGVPRRLMGRREVKVTRTTTPAVLSAPFRRPLRKAQLMPEESVDGRE